jgi:methionyl aminopeptidase
MELQVEGKLEDWKKAGKIAAQALRYGKELIKPGASLLDVSDKVEAKIRELGGEPAFPAQISCDHIAAHYCADPDDDIIFDKQVVSLDVGVHINGCIGDNAVTIDLSGKHAQLIKAAEEALQAAIQKATPGTTLGELGQAIQDAITKHGFSPIKNLSGHGLNQYNIHDRPSIPNFNNNNSFTLKKGMIIAIEPFATTGKGMVHEQERANIFALASDKNVRSNYAREVLDMVHEFDGLPFTTRWITKELGKGKTLLGLRELLKNNIIVQHPPLVEETKGIVAQAEHTILIDDTPIVLTHP